MFNIPLHVRGIITQATISGELNSFNYTVMAVIPHCYPDCVILRPHALLVQLI